MCINPIKIIVNGEEKYVKCGKCILCRRAKCREWAIKLYHESQYFNKMCMVTLTFRPKFLLRPKIKELTKYKSVKDKDGKRIRYPIKYTTMINPSYITNVKKTGWLITLFIKKLRKYMQEKGIIFEYFAVGEHGTQNTHRAHWHILFFGIDERTLNSVKIGVSKKNKDILWSPIIDKLWSYDKYGIGKHTISEVTTKTIKYIANYTMKKMYNNGTQYPYTMRFSNQNKIGYKWARRNHYELRKEYLLDGDGLKYPIPKGYLNEMKRYENSIENESMTRTAIEIEQNKDKKFNLLQKAGLLTKEELKKKAKMLEIKYAKEERDTI